VHKLLNILKPLVKVNNRGEISIIILLPSEGVAFSHEYDE